MNVVFIKKKRKGLCKSVLVRSSLISSQKGFIIKSTFCIFLCKTESETMGIFWYFFSTDAKIDTFLESCGVADLVTTCYSGRNARIGKAFVHSGKVSQHRTLRQGERVCEVTWPVHLFIWGIA